MTNKIPEWYDPSKGQPKVTQPESEPPPSMEDSKSDGAVLLALAGIATVGAAIVLGKKAPSGGGGGGGGQKSITIDGSYNCEQDNTAQVKITIVGNTGDTNYDIVRDGTIVETVRDHYSSVFFSQAQQGGLHEYQVIGVQSNIASNKINILYLHCPVGDGGGGVGQSAADITVQFS